MAKSSTESKSDRSFCSVRLRSDLLGFQLSLFYEDSFDSAFPQFLVAHDAFGPHLVIGKPVGFSLITQVDEELGPYLLEASDSEAFSDERFAIAGGDRRVVDCASRRSGSIQNALAIRAECIAADMLVGNTLVEIERLVVLQTIKRFKGDYERVAFALGISAQEISGKVLSYFGGPPSVSTSFKGDQ